MPVDVEQETIELIGSYMPMPLVMVVAVGKNFQDFGVAHQRFEYLDPIFQVAGAVDDSPVPRRCLLLNPFAVSQPAHISEVRCNQVKLLLHFPGSGHKRRICQCQGDVVFSESGIKPGFVSNLDYEFVVGRKPLQEGCEHTEKTILFRKPPAVEERELKNHRTKFWTENVHCFHELFEFRIAVH